MIIILLNDVLTNIIIYVLVNFFSTLLPRVSSLKIQINWVQFNTKDRSSSSDNFFSYT